MIRLPKRRDWEWPLRRALLGAVLGTGAPMGWLMLQWLGGIEPQAALASNPGVYLYMLIGTVCVFGVFGAYLGFQEREMAFLGLRDPLTELPNRLLFVEQLKREMARLQRNPGERFSLLMLDIDHFKHVNDSYGHPFGDQVLRELADVLRRSLRVEETAYRFGGEEFAVALPGCDSAAAIQVAERLRRAVQDQTFVYFPMRAQVRITVSIGVATANEHVSADIDELISSADQSLYRAKHLGRNRVEVSPAEGARQAVG